MMGQMASATIPTGASTDTVKQMRKAFSGVMADQAEEFMRSEVFLGAMKQAMDGALAMKQQINELLTKNLKTMQMPSRTDSDNLVLAVRGMEERLMGKLDELSQRVERLEESSNGTSKGAGKDSDAKAPKKRRGGNDR